MKKLLLVAVVAFAGFVLVGTGAAKQASSQAKGTMVIGLEQEPGILNGWITGGDALATVYVLNPMLSETYRLKPNMVFSPELISKIKIQQNPFRLTYFIKKNAYWNSGGKKIPVTAADYIADWKIHMNKSFQILDTSFYDQIKSAKTINSKTVMFTFTAPYAGYKLKFSPLLPSFATRGQDFNKMWLNFVNDPNNGGKPLSDGPFMMQNGNAWIRGRQATLVANPKWWGGKTKLAKLVFRFYPDSQTEAQQIKSGELDVFNPQPQVFLVPLRRQAGLKTQVGMGPTFEYIGFNTGFKKAQPLLGQAWFRQAFAYAIDRTAMVNALFHATGIAPTLPVYQNNWIFNGSPYYKKIWAFVKKNQQKAINMLKAHGCTGGPNTPGAGGVFTCEGHKASFPFQWRSGNQIRVLEFETLQAQVKNVGIELKADDSPDLYTSRFPRGDTDIYVAGWIGSPDLSGLDNLYGCRDDATNQAQQNYQGYCNKIVDSSLKKANVTFDTAKQAALMNKANTQLAKDMVVIPLYQKPTYLIYKNKFKGLVENPTSETFVWNIGKVTT
jgi:peptide/nickel transport system substrate-binding protein